MFQPTDLIQTVIFVVYYIIIAAIALVGLFGVYLLAAHGRSRLLSLGVGLIFILFFLSLLGNSQTTLHGLF